MLQKQVDNHFGVYSLQLGQVPGVIPSSSVKYSHIRILEKRMGQLEKGKLRAAPTATRGQQEDGTRRKMRRDSGA